ncbi:MAG: hypothetical protein LN573_00760 [Rickettsia endosymbiont of Oxypoda opaca]|nr:hypothetical protein [Rickettsia endosymbiont of Oxypoda opaca]
MALKLIKIRHDEAMRALLHDSKKVPYVILAKGGKALLRGSILSRHCEDTLLRGS